METVQEKDLAVNYVEIDGGLLLELLEGASTHATKDKGLRALNAVQIEGSGGDLVVRATDRFRLIEGSARYLDGRLEPSLVSLEDIKRIITLLKAHKAHLVNLTRVADALTVSSLGDAITFTLIDATFPNFNDLFIKSEGDPVALEGARFNPLFMADYSKIAGKGESIGISFTGEFKPIKISIAHNKINWKALLMPMRVR
jgi:DNA polymerase III sliding clamp (beta) subunit (PCNA family)